MTDNPDKDVAIHKKTSFATLDHDLSAAQHLSNRGSGNNYQRKLSFRKPRPSSAATHKQGLNTSVNSQIRPQVSTPSANQQNDRKVAQKMLSPKEYYCRLKEMQRRLDKARTDIARNVSRSRSKSPRSSNNNNSIIIMPRKQDSLPNLHNQVIQMQPTGMMQQFSVGRSSNRSLTRDNKGDQYKPFVPASLTKNNSYSGASYDRRREIMNQNTAQKSRQGNKGAGQSAQKYTPLFYTSLYNGVQPIIK